MEPQNLRDFLEWEPEFPTPILGKGIMYAGTKVILYGKYKSMKSMIVQRMGLDIANGQPWLGIDTPQNGASVLYLQLEIPHTLLQRRIKTMTAGRWSTKKPIHLWTEHFLKLDTPLGMTKLRKQLTIHRPDVLIIDPIYKVLSGNILDAQSIKGLLDNVDTLIGEFGVTVVLVSHTRKPQQEEVIGWGSDDLIGSMFFSAWADSVIQVERSQGKLRLRFDVVRHAEEEIEPLTVNIDKALTFKPEFVI